MAPQFTRKFPSLSVLLRNSNLGPESSGIFFPVGFFIGANSSWRVPWFVLVVSSRNSQLRTGFPGSGVGTEPRFGSFLAVPHIKEFVGKRQQVGVDSRS